MNSQTTMLNDEILSQKLGELSPFQIDTEGKKSTINNNDSQVIISSIESSLLMKNIAIHLQSNPDYLHESFKEQYQSILPWSITLNDLRDVAIYKHKLKFIEIITSLWINYRKSGTGEYEPKQSIERKIWPKKVKLLMEQCQIDNINDETCLTFVNQCLNELKYISEQYQRELHIKRNLLSGYTHALEDSLAKLIGQGLAPLRVEIDQEIALIQYYYCNKMFKYNYLSQNPNAQQKKWMKRLCKLKYNQELTEHEVILLNEKISLHLRSHPFQCEPIAKLSCINQIQNLKYKEQLYNQYKIAAEETRNNMMNMYIECAEEQRQQCQHQYEMTMKEIQDIQISLPVNEQLTETMWTIIQQRLAHISTYVKYMYQLKTELFHLEAKA